MTEQPDQPEFFLPAATGEEQEERVYGFIKEFLSTQLGAVFSDRRIFQLEYVHDGMHYFAEVGATHALNGETVVAILFDTAYKIYHVCTANRGVLRGMPILVGVGLVKSSQSFKPRKSG